MRCHYDPVIHKGAPVSHCFSEGFTRSSLQMPPLSVPSDENFKFYAGQFIEQALMPGFCAYCHRWKITALGVVAWKAKAHRHHRNFVWVIEIFVTDPHPRPQADTRWVVERLSSLVSKVARRLACDKDPGTAMKLKDRIRRIGHITLTNLTGAELGKQGIEALRHGNHIPSVKNTCPEGLFDVTCN